MDFRTYQQIRTYCCNDLQAYLDLPGYDSMRKLWGKLNGQVGLIQREQQLAVSLHQCSDLTPRERAAAELLAVISNHRAIAWQREPKPPHGNEPAPPLNQVELEALENQTRDAVRRYVAFLPEPERAVLLADCEAALEGAYDTKVEAASVSEPVTSALRRQNSKWTDAELRTLQDEFNMPGATYTSLGKKHGLSRQRISTLLKEAKGKFSSYNKPKSPFDISRLTGLTKNKGTKY